MAMPGSKIFTEEHKKFLSPNQLVTRDRETGIIVTFTLNEEEFKLALSKKNADWDKMCESVLKRNRLVDLKAKSIKGNFDLLWLNGRPVHWLR